MHRTLVGSGPFLGILGVTHSLAGPRQLSSNLFRVEPAQLYLAFSVIDIAVGLEALWRWRSTIWQIA